MAVRRILYIEDDDSAYHLVKIVLSEGAPGITLERACNGEEALRSLLGQEAEGTRILPDLILLDLNLPRKDGIEVLKDLKASELLREIPVVMFSTSSAAKDKDAALQGGAQGYVTKPSSFDLFVEAVKKACLLP